MEEYHTNILDAYTVQETIFESSNVIVYRATRDGRSFVIKCARDDSPKSRSKLTKEYETVKTFDTPYVVKHLTIENIRNGVALISEDFGAIGLLDYIRGNCKNGMEINDFLSIALQLVEGLNLIHQKGLIHGGISSRNILINPATKQIKYTDFGFSSEIDKAFQSVIPPNTFEPILHYISPEQTGRMNRDIDYRTDYYSLGVVFYEILSGKVPFTTEDRLDIIYNHIAMAPVNLDSVNPRVPNAISTIVMLLLKKNADDRYQSTYSLKKDLLQIKKNLETGISLENFKPRTNDVRSRFQIAQHLYGRDKEIKELINSFEEISEMTVSSILLLVSGYSGIGKSALIQEIYRPLVKRSGYFISGKFDQFKRNIPYASFIQAFKQLMQSVLTESDQKIAIWREKLLGALGTRGQVIIDVIPEVELIIGNQPPVPDLPPSEKQVRFNRVLRDFISVFAQPEHPVVIVLDDLQWADVPTLHLIEVLMKDPESRCLLVIGAYRDNEVGETHPLKVTLTAVEKVRPIRRISLEPLTSEYINLMIADSLKSDVEETKELAELVAKKTHGNPFFIIMFLRTLVQEKYIYFDFVTGNWKWDLPRIKNTKITDNVVEMMMGRIQLLPPETQSLLSLAAAIGNTFELYLLSQISQQSMTQLASILEPALTHGLVIQLGQDFKWLKSAETSETPLVYQFLHDRVQQASYEVIDSNQSKNIHLKIGRLLLDKLSESEIEERLFDIVSNFMSAKQLLTDPNERLRVIELLLRAGHRAKDNSAYHPAASFFFFASELLPSNSWEVHYDLSFEVYRQLVECEYLRGNFKSAEEMYPNIIVRCKTDLEKISIYHIKSCQLETQQRFSEAIETLRYCLELMGINLPTEESKLDEALKEEFTLVSVNLAGKSSEDLFLAPDITTPKHKTIMQLLSGMWTPVYATGMYKLTSLVSAKMLNITLTNGNCELSSLAYSYYAFLAGEMTNKYSETFELGLIGLRLADKYPDIVAKCKSNFLFGCATAVFNRHLSLTIEHLEKSFQYGMECGSIPFCSYASHHIVNKKFGVGESLQSVSEAFTFYIRNYLYNNNRFTYWLGLASTQLFQALVGINDFDEVKFLEEGKKFPILMAAYYYGKLLMCYTMDTLEDESLLELAEITLEISPKLLIGTYKVIEIYFYVSLAFLRVAQSLTDETKRRDLVNRVEPLLSQLKIWAAACPENVKHKYLLVEAEVAAVLGNMVLAVELYNKSIRSASEYRFVQFEALANELCARLWCNKGHLKYAKVHMQDAYYLYSQWGAIMKTRRLRSTCPSLLDLRDTDISASDPIADMESSVLDVLTIYKASQALSSETRLDHLLDHMMKIIIENAGAQKGVFMLAETRGSNLLVVAEGGKDDMQIDTLRAISFDAYNNCPKSIVNYVWRTKETIIIGNCMTNNQFETDPFISNNQLKSVLCMPILRQNDFKGVLYLQNDLITNAFTHQRARFLGLLAAQMSITLENARFSSLLESEKKYRAIAAELEFRKKRLEEFIDVLCHELRNPLNGIYGNTGVISDVLATMSAVVTANAPAIQSETYRALESFTRELKEAAESITISSDHLKDIVDTVLNVSALENQDSAIALQNQVFEPSDVIQRVVSMFRARLAEKKVAINSMFPESECIVSGDPYRFKEILINLITNAIKFTEAGMITVSFESRIELADTVLRCTIEDTGIGMTEQEKQKLFKPFSQANSQISSKYGGSGLGLKISKQFIERMGGTIEVESQKGIGSKFIFTIRCQTPTEEAIEFYKQTRVKEQKSSSRSPPVPASSSGARQLHLLIVEDNIINQKLLTKILEQKAHSCTLANNGSEAVKQFKNQQFDMVFMDIEMPVMNGIDATHSIRIHETENHLDPVPIIGLSANTRKEYIDRALNVGMNGYITKPYIKNTIYTTIEKFMTSNMIT